MGAFFAWIGSMRFDDITAPISEADPCGPDLDEEGDDAYLNYVLSAAGRIPESFFQRDPNAPVNDQRYLPFDRGSIDLKAEVKTISDLLTRTKDLRLLTLEARFQSLAGQVLGLCECLQGMAMLVDTYWQDVHPRGMDGDYTMRQNTLSGLDDQTSILLPLTYAPLTTSKKLGSISLRDCLLAKGETQPREGDRKLDMSEILEAFRSPEVKSGVESLHAATKTAVLSLGAINAKFISAAGYEYNPGFAKLAATLEQIRGLVETAIPELAAGKSEAELPPAAEEGASNDIPESEPFPQAAAPAAPVLALPDHAAASGALLAVEQYFAHAEPSSPVLILVHQARTLVGKSLVEALEMLMPEAAEKAVIAFTGGPAFKLDMNRMKAITQTATQGAQANGADGDACKFSASTRQEAESLISSVDAFFRTREPSSPIPMLIARARMFMNRDFSAILADLVKNDASAPPSADAPKTN
jgi:type VI secretion system protein ImpA